jgi:hypothetical protein
VQLGGEHLLVPAGVERELVVGDDIGPVLRRREVVEHDHRHRVEPEPARRLEPSVAGDHGAVAGGEDRIGPAELHDAGGDLRHLLVRMRARVARIGAQARERPVLDRVGQPWRHGPRIPDRWAVTAGW